MTVTQYIGARYVPLFAEPEQWDSTREYEPLTIVLHQGNSFTSKQSVPIGIDITDESFWACTGNYNAQVEQYRREVRAFDGRISDVEDNFNENGEIEADHIAAGAVTTDKLEDGAVTASKLAADSVDTGSVVDGAITASKLAADSVDTATVIDGAITASKLAADSVDTGNIIDKTILRQDVNPSTFAFENRKLVVIGDSLSNGSHATKYWPEFFEEMYGAEAFNFAVAGQGFVNNANGTFDGQADNAIASSAFENADITDVVILGGYNDYSYTDTQIQEAVRSLVTKCKGAFENAIIWVGAMLKGVYPLDYAIGGASEAQYRSRKISPIEFNAAWSGAVIIPQPWTWLMGEMNWNIDNIHVNASGQQFIATRVYQVLNGASPVPMKRARITTSNASVEEVHCECYAIGGMVNVWGHFKTTAATGTTTIIQLPEWAYS